MNHIAKALDDYISNHPFESEIEDETILDQLYRAYAESHESDPSEIQKGFQELGCYLEALPLQENNAIFLLCSRLCIAFERKAFRDGLLYGAYLMQELHTGEQC